ncbi:MAG: hypothetical protein P1P65_06265 [Treponema sp.]
MNKKLRICCILFLSISFTAWAQKTDPTEKLPILDFQFIRQPISDIIYALSVYSEIPIVANKTVSGTATFQFNGTDFETAFETFLSLNNLYVDKQPHIWTVSKIRLQIAPSGTVALDASDVSLNVLIEYISRETGVTVVTDLLPNTAVSIHIKSSTVVDSINVIMKAYDGYSVIDSGSHLHIKKNHAVSASSSWKTSYLMDVREADGRFNVKVQKAVLAEILEALFRSAGKEYSSFINGDQIIEHIEFTEKNFEDALRYILEQARAEYVLQDTMYYLLPVQQNDVIAKLKREGKTWRLFRLKHKAVQDINGLLHIQYPDLPVTPLPDNSGFFALVESDTGSSLQNWLKIVDTAVNSSLIKLRYIKTEDLLKRLPPSVTQANIVDAGDGSSFFYIGSEEQKEAFLKDIVFIDKPHTQLRYDLLIIQYQSVDSFNWNFNVAARGLKPGDQTLVTGMLGGLLALNFDAISVFGYQFAAKLSTAMGDSKASIFADTMLYGLSGQEIKFQNTNTYRYRDSTIDPETGKQKYTGVTREIISGLKLTINGWVSGDGVITTSITASVSKRGADVSQNTGNPPPTSEKVVTTHVRSRSGEPVILSGLKQNDTSSSQEGVPGLSKIPGLGLLFKDKTSTTEKTEMVIYLVPHIDYAGDDSGNSKLKRDSIFERLVEPYLP